MPFFINHEQMEKYRLIIVNINRYLLLKSAFYIVQSVKKKFIHFMADILLIDYKWMLISSPTLFACLFKLFCKHLKLVRSIRSANKWLIMNKRCTRLTIMLTRVILFSLLGVYISEYWMSKCTYLLKWYD